MISIALICIFQFYFLRGSSSAKHPSLCHVGSVTYSSSALELDTHSKSKEWQNKYCSRYFDEAQNRDSLLTIVHHVNQEKNCRVPRAGNPPGSLSQFTTTVICGNEKYEVTTLIEPIYAAMRHPDAVPCASRDAQPIPPFPDIMAVDYIITADSHSPAVLHARQKVYIDLGASLWPHLSQKWMVEHYEERGVIFDRMLFWEATPMTGDQILDKVPPKYYRAFQYFNTPFTADRDSPSNPLNILKSIAVADDFVAFKLDVDNTVIEADMLAQIINDPAVYSLIDELYWEPHYNFATLIDCCWLGSANRSLSHAEVWETFVALRKRGIRAHGWP